MLSGTYAKAHGSVRSIRSLLPSKLKPSPSFADTFDDAASYSQDTDADSLYSASGSVYSSVQRGRSGTAVPLQASPGGVKHLHLPPSIAGAEDVSRALWTWIHGGDFVSREEVERRVESWGVGGVGVGTRVVTCDGVLVDVLEGFEREGAGRGGAVVGGRKLVGMEGSPKKARSALPDMFRQPKPEKPKIHRFFLQIVELGVKTKTNVESVICKVQLNSQKGTTAPITLRKEQSKGFGLVAQPGEAFLFDTQNTSEYTITIRLHAAPPPQPPRLPHSSSTYSLYNTLTPSSSNDALPERHRRTHISQFLGSIRTRNPTVTMNNGEAMPLLGEVSFSLPTTPAFGKMTATYNLTLNGKKEMARVRLQVGMFVDEEREVEPEQPPLEDLADYLNFLVRTKGASKQQIWRKYWCVARGYDLFVYDFEYRESKPAITTLHLPTIITTHPADPEQVCARDCFQLVLSDHFTTTDAAFSDVSASETHALWRASIVDQDERTHKSVAYAAADSTERMDVWMERVGKCTVEGFRGGLMGRSKRVDGAKEKGRGQGLKKGGLDVSVRDVLNATAPFGVSCPVPSSAGRGDASNVLGSPSLERGNAMIVRRRNATDAPPQQQPRPMSQETIVPPPRDEYVTEKEKETVPGIRSSPSPSPPTSMTTITAGMATAEPLTEPKPKSTTPESMRESPVSAFSTSSPRATSPVSELLSSSSASSGGSGGGMTTTAGGVPVPPPRKTHAVARKAVVRDLAARFEG
ncbi:hypothetical protein HDV00_000166 [Rhizophlyctis rosea]|nr:hypothetical protein HDV00_000166 [Rhizophlyctis rosea]